MYSVKIKNSAKKDLKKLKQSNLREQFEEIIQTLKKNPYEQSQSFKKLMPKELNRYSRRLNVQHRVVYTVDDHAKVVQIYSAWSHYE